MSRSYTCSSQMCCACDGGRHKGPVTRRVKSATRGAVVISTRLQTPHWPFLHRPPTLQGLAAVRCSQTASLPPGVPMEELQPSRGSLCVGLVACETQGRLLRSKCRHRLALDWWGHTQECARASSSLVTTGSPCPASRTSGCDGQESQGKVAEILLSAPRECGRWQCSGGADSGLASCMAAPQEPLQCLWPFLQTPGSCRPGLWGLL